MLHLFKRLLPQGRAFSLVINKRLKQFFSGLAAGTATPLKQQFDNVFNEIDPQKTQSLAQWEQQFFLPNAGLTEQQRRDRLAAAWQSIGGQSAHYIQTTLQNAGFDVYIHNWWQPGTEPPLNERVCAIPRNPLLVLKQSSDAPTVFIECGTPGAECGEPGIECGERLNKIGYPLVNKVLQTSPDYFSCGEPAAECGEPEIECYNYVSLIEKRRAYVVSSDPTKWPFYFYICGPVYGEPAQVQASRKDEFETLILKIKPRHLWAGVIVEFN